MLGLPADTEVNKIIPKNAFYRNADISSSLKTLFINDISKIVLTNTLSAKTLKCGKGKQVEEIEVFCLEPKKDNVAHEILNCIDKSIQYHSLFVISRDLNLELLIAFKERNKTNKNAFVVNKYYSKSVEPDFKLPVDGLNMDKIYENLVRFVADDNLLKSDNSETLKQSFNRQAEIDKINAEIDKLTIRMNKEKQFNKQIAIKDKIAKLLSQLN